MAAAVFIGDEVSAGGFRLTGIDTLMPEPADAGDALRAARKVTALVIMTAELASHVPPAELAAALIAEAPLFAVVPDVRGQTPAPDLAGKLRRVLGLEE